MDDRLVTIKTHSGKWSREVSLDDPIFSDILAPLVELDDEVGEIVLPETLSEIIEAEWNDVEKVLRRTKVGKQGGRISLNRIARISRLLNLPEGWWHHVYASREDEGYFDHLTLISRGKIEFTPSESTPTGHYVLEMEKYFGKQERIRKLIRAVVRNDILRVADNNPPLSTVDWDAILHLAQKEDLVLPSIVSDTLLTLAGRGDIHKETVPSHITLVWYGSELMERVPMYLADTYKLALKSIPETINPKLLMNSRSIVQTYPGFRPFPNLILNVVPWTHTILIYSAKLTLDDSRLPTIFEKHIVGRRGLVKILLTILGAMERDVDVGEVLETLAINIEKRLEEPAPKQVGDYLPSGRLD